MLDVEYLKSYLRYEEGNLYWKVKVKCHGGIPNAR